MRTLTFWTVVLFFAGLAGLAQAESIYRYYDPQTKRDVFVNRLEQVPSQHREQAQPVVADGVLVGTSHQPGNNTRQGTVIFGGNPSASVLETLKQALLEAGDGPWDGKFERLLTMLMDTGMVKAGKPPLTAAHVLHVTYMVGVAALALSVSCLLALVACIFVMVHAFRNDHPVWGVCILLVPPLGILYVLFHIESKRRWFKWTTLVGQISPLLILTIAIWRFYAYFTTIHG
jgi:hypothetical protein